jgi:hypothetical protein
MTSSSAGGTARGPVAVEEEGQRPSRGLAVYDGTVETAWCPG